MFTLLPRDEKFYDELEKLGDLVDRASKELVQLLGAFPKTDEGLQRIADFDREADKVTQGALERLDHAFITPLDREDILHLLTDLYVVVETVLSFARRLSLYHLQEVEADLRDQSGILAEMAGCVSTVMKRLREDHQLKTLNGELKKLHDLERTSDEKRNDFLRRLFEGTPDPLAVMKKKELHDLLERAIGNCQDVSRTLQRVVLKNT